MSATAKTKLPINNVSIICIIFIINSVSIVNNISLVVI